MQVNEITYTTEIIETYTQAIHACLTVNALCAELLANWFDLCPDALQQANGLTDEDWTWTHRNSSA
jgi:hypothetical protein